MYKRQSGKSARVNEDAVMQLQQALNSRELVGLLLDEVSTVDTKIIALISNRLQQIMGNDLPFGGLPVLMSGECGDMQLMSKHPIRGAFSKSQHPHHKHQPCSLVCGSGKNRSADVQLPQLVACCLSE